MKRKIATLRKVIANNLVDNGVFSKKSGKKVVILMYHGIDKVQNTTFNERFFSVANFEQQIAAFKKHFHILTYSDFINGNYSKSKTNVLLTFDDGYEDFYTNAYPIFKKYGWTATVYIITGKIGGDYMTWDQIRELSAAGFEVGAHTINHPDLSTLSEAKQHTEIFGSKQTLETELGKPVTTFAYPSGKHNDTTVSLVKAAGFTTAVTTAFGPVKSSDPNPLLYTRYRMSPDMSDKTLDSYFKP